MVNEAQLVDWYGVLESVANGRLEGLVCPYCRAGLEVTPVGRHHRIRCSDCGEGVEGRFGRDDDSGRSPVGGQPAEPSVAAPAAPETVPETAPEAPPAPARPEPWEWRLPAGGASDPAGLSRWAEVVESIHNGRRTGLRCPLCSEPLTEIQQRRPYIRVRCAVCGEGFEGRLG